LFRLLFVEVVFQRISADTDAVRTQLMDENGKRLRRKFQDLHCTFGKAFDERFLLRFGGLSLTHCDRNNGHLSSMHSVSSV
ncbi:MAG: hypothetical protein P8010_11965, partial [Desulfosarcinaceae bacterium]